MIEDLIPYGGVIYWLLLFLGIFLTTIFAMRQKCPLAPLICTGLTGVAVFGFTDYEPDLVPFFLGFISYLIVGCMYSWYRWAKLVYEIKRFMASVDPLIGSNLILAKAAFRPNDVEGDLHIPPDPYQFRTRILMWILFWPSYSMFSWIDILHRKVSTGIWNLFLKISEGIYDR